MMRPRPFWRANPAVAAALAIAVVGAATIAGAWFFELVLEAAAVPALPRAALCLITSAFRSR